MQAGRDDGGPRAPSVIWQARPRPATVLLELLGALVVTGLSVFLLQLGRAPRTWVRELPIPTDEVPEAFETIARWRAQATRAVHG